MHAPDVVGGKRLRVAIALAIFVVLAITGAEGAEAQGGGGGQSSGLVAAYGFEEGSGANVADASGEGNAGTVSGASWATNGRFGRALSFDGDDDMVSVADADSLDLTGGMTLEAWIRPADNSGWRTALLKEEPGSHVYALYGDISGGGPSVEGEGAAATAPPGLVPLGSWTHLAGTYDGSQLKLYINGELIATAQTSGNLDVSGGALRIGANTVWDAEDFDGLIDEVRIYNRALSAEEIGEDMGRPVVPVAPGSGLVGAYGFEEGSGANVADASGEGNAGTVSGASWATNGRFGRALSFDGEGDMVSVPDAESLDLSAGMTLEAWIRPDVTGWQTVLVKERPAHHHVYVLYGDIDGGGPRIEGAGEDATAPNGLVPLGSWTHLAGTYDGSTLKLYVNGELAASAPASGSILTSDGAFRIGANTVWGGEDFDGLIDEVRIYNRALSAEEIGEDMGRPVVPVAPGSGLVGAYGFEEGSGSGVVDSSSAGNDGSFEGAARTEAGRFGRALSFDGGDDMVSVPDSDSLDLTTGMTLEAWVKPRSGDEWQTVVLKERLDSLSYALYNGSSAGAPTISLWTETEWVELGGPGSLAIGQWSHLAATYDGQQLRAYVDGEVVASRALDSAAFTSGDPLRIGANTNWGGEDFDGLIDEVRIYNRALGAEEIGEDMGTPVAPTNPWTLHEPSVVNRTGATLHWSRWGGSGFGGYEVHRGAEAGFATSTATRLATIENVDVTTYRDDSAAPGSTVFYKLVTAGQSSNEQRAVLPAEHEPARATLQPGPDRGQATWIRPDQPSPCPNSDHEVDLRIDSDEDYRGLLRWDLGDIPADSRVHSARLMLHRISAPDGPTTLAARPVNREWRESSHADCPGDGVSWLRAHGGVSWSTPGGDVGPVAASADVAAGTPSGWSEWDVSTVVQEWIAGGRANHGLMVSGVAGDMRLDSDDSSLAALRPKLEIVFDDPEPVHVPTVELTAPRGGEQLRETVTVAATAGDDRRVERVEVLLDGQEFGEDGSAPYKVDWDTRSAANGSHTLRARAVDDVGNIGLSEPVAVEVANFAPPTVSLTNPPAGYPGAVKLEGPTALDGVAGYWRLGETSGEAEDASGNGRTGTYLGAVERGLPGLIVGDSDRSVRLMPTTGRVELTNLAGWLGDRFTAEGWIKHPGLTSNGAESHVASRSPGGADGWKLGVRRTAAGAQEAFFNFKGATVTTPIAPSPTDPPVYHLVGVYDGTSIRLHLDGRQVGQAGVNGTANMSVAPLIGPASAADIHVDDVALYHAALSPERIRAHFELGRGRAFLVEGQNELSATASAAPGLTVREVRFLVDDQLVGRDDTAPYSVTWSTLPAGSPVPDGPHVVTAQVVDDHDQITTSDAVTVNVSNNTVPQQQAELTSEGELPETLVDEPNAPAVPVDIRIRNSGTAAIPGTAAVLRYRWVRPDDSVDDSLSGSYALGGDVAPGAHRVVRAMVRPPALPEGLARSRMTLRFDLRDSGGGQAWWAERGNPPLEHSVMVQRSGAIGLGLERYYQYDGEALGGGMSQLVNLASGNNIVRFSPFAAPGRGLSTVVDLTYNAQGGETKGSALGDGWLLSVSSLSPFGEPLRCGVGTDAELKPDKCEEYALKDQQDLPSLALELTDADGTVHRFSGRRTGGRTFWRAPQGVHLYVHQLEADEQPECDIVEPGMAYQPDIQPGIQALWAFTRPDGTTFYYQRNGWPTGVADRNGNCIDLELTAPPSKPDRVRVSAVIDAAGVADPALRPRRTFAIDYYDDEPHPLGGKTDFPKVKSIRDHSGSKLSFHYYKDDRPLRITQQGGTTTDGLAAPDRSWVFTYADWDIDEEETVANLPNPAARVNPDPTITDNSYLLYSVRDPRGQETKFTYHGEKPQEQKANAGKLKYRVDRTGAQTTYNYNLATDTTTVDLPAERQSRYAFDVEGSALSMIDKISATREEIVRVSWTADRHVFKVTEPTEVGVPAEHFTEFEYNQNGLLTKRRDQLDRVTELEYEHIAVDDDDQESGWVDEDREIEHISQLTKRITPRGKQWEFDHDDETGNLLELEDPEDFASRYLYDEHGNLTESNDGLDGDGNLPNGELERTTLYDGYDANGLPTLVTDALGNETRFCSDDDGLLRWVQDARHAGSPLPTDWSRCHEHEGRRFRSYFDYDPFHRLGRTSEPKLTDDSTAGVLWTHARYDSNDNVVEDFGAQESHEFQPGQGARTTIAYDAMDRPTRETLFDFDTLPPQQQGGPLESFEVEETTVVVYDAAGRPERVTSPRGVASGVSNDFSTAYVYDLLDRPLVVTRHGIGGQERPSWFCYDAAGDLRSVTRPRETPEPASCGPEGAQGDPGPEFTWRYEYTPAHQLHRVISPGGNVTSYSYDPDGNLAETVNPEGEKVNRSYDGRNLPVETVEDFEPGRRLTTRFTYDAVGNVRHVFSPRAFEAADGEATPESDFVHTTEYDALDRPVRELLPRQGDEDQRYVHRRFDAVGNLTHITVPVLEDDLDTLLGPPEQASDCKAEETRKWVTCYEHFDPGWIKTSRDINGLVLFDYDPEGRQERRTATDIGETTSRTYYRDGLLETFTDEGDNRLLRRYDLNGNPRFLSDDGVSSTRKPITLELEHNGFDEVASTTASEEGQRTKVTEYTYWLDGLVHTRADDREEEGSQVVRAARRHEFFYDPDGRLSVHLDFGRDAGTGDDRRIRHDYFPTGRERERVVENWVGGAFETRQTTQREYFDNGLPRTLNTWGGAAGTAPHRESHTLAYRDPGEDPGVPDGDFVGHMTSDEFFRDSPEPGALCSTPSTKCTQRFVYDGGDRLVEEYDGHDRRTHYTLTPAGGIREKYDADDEQDVFFRAEFDGPRMAARTIDPNDRLNVPGPTEEEVFHYEDGNLDCITRPGAVPDRDCSRSGGEPSPLLVQDFTYDYRDRLEAWERPEEDLTVRYEHDALDRPIQETEESDDGTTIHKLSYVGATRQLAGEQETGLRQKTRSYSHDAYGRLVALSYSSEGGPTHELTYAYDPRDNVSMLLDEAGAPKAAYGYTAYGQPDEALTAELLPDTGDDPDPTEQVNPFRYSSKRTDALSDTIDMGARQFGPDLGQFLQGDRFDSALADLGLASDPLNGNRYALAAGNPITYGEIDGHISGERLFGAVGPNAPNTNPQTSATVDNNNSGSSGTVFGQSITAPLLEGSPDGAGAESADDSGGRGSRSPLDAIGSAAGDAFSGAADAVGDIAVGQYMHQATCGIESQLDFWNTDCFKESIPNPKATFEACTQGNPFEAGGRLTVCVGSVVATRRGIAPRSADPGTTAPQIKPGSAGGPTAGKPFSRRVREQALEENPSTCVFCRMQSDAPHVDHAIPRARGGNATIDNAQITCPHCNRSKGARDAPLTPPPGYRGPWPPPWWRSW